MQVSFYEIASATESDLQSIFRSKKGFDSIHCFLNLPLSGGFFCCSYLCFTLCMIELIRTIVLIYLFPAALIM